MCDTKAQVEEARQRVSTRAHAARARAASGEDEDGRPLARTRGFRLPRVSSAQAHERAHLGADAATRLLPPAVAVATCDGAGARPRAGADASRAVSHGPPHRHCGPQSGAPRLGPVLSHGQCGGPIHRRSTSTSSDDSAACSLKRAGSSSDRRSGRGCGLVPSSKPLGSFACAARFSIRGWRMPRPEDHLVSRVREIRMHGLNGGLTLTQSASPTGDK